MRCETKNLKPLRETQHPGLGLFTTEADGEGKIQLRLVKLVTSVTPNSDLIHKLQILSRSQPPPRRKAIVFSRARAQ
jgi:hypothetical protein